MPRRCDGPTPLSQCSRPAPPKRLPPSRDYPRTKNLRADALEAVGAGPQEEVRQARREELGVILFLSTDLLSHEIY